MSEQLIVSILFELLDFAIRANEGREDVEKYIALRTELRKKLVAEITNPVEPTSDSAPSNQSPG